MANNFPSGDNNTGDDKAAFDAAYREALERFGNRENVTGIDIGFKYTDGQKTSVRSIRLHVKEKLSVAALEPADTFPAQINGVPVDVLQANYKAGLQNAPSLELMNRNRRFAKIQPGISIGHPNTTAGTLGLIVKDQQTGKPAILSNWHVLAVNKNGKQGDEIMQPGRFDGGKAPRDTIARLERMMLDNDGDAAIGLITDDRPFDLNIIGLNITPDSLKDPEDGDVVIKSSRTTEVTKGRVDGKGRYFINYPVGRIGIDGFRIITLETGNPNNIEISKSGDSGAAWLFENSQTMAGLHFAGETNPLPEEEYALACYATTVFSRLAIDLFVNKPAIEILQGDAVSKDAGIELGKAVVSNLLNRVHQNQIREWAELLEKNYPDLLNGEGLSEELEEIIKPELGAFGLMAIGFAAGAVSKMVNEPGNNNAVSPANFSLAIAAFLSGVIAGNRAMEERG